MPILALLYIRPRRRAVLRWWACAMLVAWLALVGSAPPALAAGLPFQAEVWIDQSGNADLTQAQRQNFAPAPDT